MVRDPLRHLQDRHSCPHCGEPLHTQPYLMSRRAEANVLSARFIAWFVVFTLALLLLTAHA